jgi:hypothetical protein
MYGVSRWEAKCANCGQLMTFIVPPSDSLGRRLPELQDAMPGASETERVMVPRSHSETGRFFAFGEYTAFRHPEIWARQATTGPDRLCIGGGEDPVKLLVALAQALAEPLFVLAVISVSMAGNAAKYESEAMTHGDVALFFDEFGKLFSEHGRAEAWVGSTQDEGLIVLDEHDLLYAYGPFDEFERILRDRGFTAGLPELPVPHWHAFNAELAEEVRLREWSGWRRVLPLEDDE